LRIPSFVYIQSKSVRGACHTLEKAGGKATAIAGGTDLLPALKNRLKSPEALVDLQRIPGLDTIKRSRGGDLRIGCMVTLRDLAADPSVQQDFPALASAAGEVGSVQLQAMGTVGGNLCQDSCCLYYNRSASLRNMLEPCRKLGGDVCHAVHRSKVCWAAYQGDLAPALLALGAQIMVTGPSGRIEMPLARLFTGDGKRAQSLEPGQLVTSIRLTAPAPGSSSAYLKLRVRKSIDYPLLGVAAAVSMAEGVCRAASVALTGVERAPVVVTEAASLAGRSLSAEDVDTVADAAFRRAHPLANASELTPAYRREMVRVYVRRALAEARNRAEERREP
jgi:4-hydroxybenzoyl-CoA reductase subunit beta